MTGITTITEKDSPKEMTLEDLENFKGMIAELKALDQEREDAYLPYSGGWAESTGAARGNEPSNPTERAAFRILRLTEQINQRREEIAEKLDWISEWISELPSAELRAIIHNYYILGYTWSDTCLRVYGYRSRQACRVRVMRFFGKEK